MKIACFNPNEALGFTLDFGGYDISALPLKYFDNIVKAVSNIGTEFYTGMYLPDF